MSHHLLEVKDLAVEFHTRERTVYAVAGIDYHVERGETLAILGESGSGKSVQASAVMGILDTPPGKITRGEIFFDGDDLLQLREGKRRVLNGHRVAMIFQDTLAHLNPVYPIGWQIGETLSRGDHAVDDPTAEVLRLLDRVGIPTPTKRINDYPHQFSGGQRQRVMIAMALALKPELLIADEPTTALDVTVQAQILALLQELKTETGMGLILITHDLGVVAQTADRVVVMQRGKIVESGTTRVVFQHPTNAYTRELIAAIPGSGQRREKAPDQIEPILDVTNLSKHFDLTKGLMRKKTGEVVKAVDGVSFNLNPGETLGIVGESGSGKSTLARMLLRLEKPSGGLAHYKGNDIQTLEGKSLLDYRKKLQVVFQDPYASLNPRMTVFQIIAEPWMIHKGVLPRAMWREKVLDLLSQVGMDADHANRHPHQFSGGQRQRIAIARALALQPEIIICDEAVSALDVSIQAQVIELLKDLRDQLNIAYLFIAHDLPVIHDIADRVMVMKSGRVVETGSVSQIFESPEHDYTKALLAASPIADPEYVRQH